jgi:hypothetical protein
MNTVTPEFDNKTAIIRMEAWIRSVGTTTLPLLAGFSITAVVVVIGSPSFFLWPGVTVFLLTAAAVALIIAVQRAYHACMDLSEYEVGAGTTSDFARISELVIHTRRAYRIGLLFFLAGLTLAVAPEHVSGVEDVFRVFAAVVAFGACSYEGWWMWQDEWIQRRSKSSGGQQGTS